MKPVITILNQKFKVRDLVVIILCYLFLEPIFSWLLIQNGALLDKFEQILSLGIFVFVIINFRKLGVQDQVIIGVFTVLVAKLIIESLIFYGSVFEYLAMYSVLFPVVYIVFCKYIFRTLKFDILEILAKFYLFSYFVFMIFFGRSFSFGLEHYYLTGYLGPFSGDSRIIHAKSILMILIPFLWYLNKYLKTKTWQSLLITTVCFIIILIHQHRSVWSCFIFAVGFYFLLLVRSEKGIRPSVIKFAFVSVILFGFSLFVLNVLKPDMVDFFAERFNEILEPTKEDSTNSFRNQQREVYFALYTEKPILGWSYQGYELPNPLVDWWPAKTGQHFHEGYMEILFYHGIVGLVLKYFFLCLIFLKSWKKRLTRNAIVLIPFCLSGLIFSLAYVPPLIFWGHVGLCLHYLDSKGLKIEV